MQRGRGCVYLVHLVPPLPIFLSPAFPTLSSAHILSKKIWTKHDRGHFPILNSACQPNAHVCFCLTTLSPAARPSFHPQCLQMNALPVNSEVQPRLKTLHHAGSMEMTEVHFSLLKPHGHDRETGCCVVKTATENVTVMPQATWRADSPLSQQICK